MSPGPVPPLLPKRGSPTACSSDECPKTNNSLLASIQKGIKLKKPPAINDRSAPKLGSAPETESKSPAVPIRSKQEPSIGSGQEPSIGKAQGLFSNGFPQLKKAPPKTEKQINPIQQSKNHFQSTSDSPISASKNSLGTSSTPQSNSIQKSPISSNIGQVPRSQPVPIMPQKISNPISKWNFNTRFVPQTVPKENFKEPKRYPSGARQGLNQYCPDAAKLSFFDAAESHELVQETRQKLKASLRQAANDEQFELCVEIKRYIQALDRPQEPESINQLISEIKEQLNI